MGRRLSKFVHVVDKDGNPHAFGPDDEVPAWAAKLITNPKAWAEGTTPAKPTPAPAATSASAPTPTQTAPTPPAAVHTGSAHQEMPPKAGPGSGADAWIGYARHLGLTVPDDAPRGDVIEAVETHLAGSQS